MAERKVSPAVGDHSTHGPCFPPWDGQVSGSGVCCGVTLCPGVCGPLGPANVRGANLSRTVQSREMLTWKAKKHLVSCCYVPCPVPRLSPSWQVHGRHCNHCCPRLPAPLSVELSVQRRGGRGHFQGSPELQRERCSSKTLQVSAKACWHSKNLLAGSLKNKWEYLKGTCTFI